MTLNCRKLLAICAAVLGLSRALAGDFSVHPIRIDLGPSMKSGAISVRNDGDARISFQVHAMAWTQDETGKDRYDESQDLVYFPRMLSVEPGEEGLIRVGAKRTLLESEKTYRLFIEELPPENAKSVAKGSAQVSMLMRFGAPVFVAAAKPQDSVEIVNANLEKGVVGFSARNTGNRHQVVRGIDLKGTDATGSQVFALTMADRYLLAGATKFFTTTIPAERCSKIVIMAIDVKTDKADASRELAVTPAMCP